MIDIGLLALQTADAGMPVPDFTVSLLPENATAVKNAANRYIVSSLKDPVSGITLSQDSDNRRPELVTDSDNRKVIRFDANDTTNLVASNVNIDTWISSTGAQSGKQTTILTVLKPAAADGTGIHFQWAKRINATTLDTNNKVTEYIPWNDKKVYIDFKDSGAGGRTVTPSISTSIGQMNTWLYERNGTVSTIYNNGASVVTKNTLSTSLGDGSTGDVILGAGQNATGVRNAVSMDFYAIYIYPRVLTDAEKVKLFAWTKKVYGV